jgi:tetratricopeptide (TPR) repeat protein
MGTRTACSRHSATIFEMTPQRSAFLCAVCLAGAFAAPASAQRLPELTPRSGAAPQEGIFLVFPFENDGAGAPLDWLSEGLEELTIQRLSSAGQQVYSHAGRAAELERYGLPASAQFSHATMLRIGTDLDADYIVFGGFTSDGKTLTVQARILRTHPVALLPPVRESGPLDSLMEIHARLIWRLLTVNDPKYKQTLAQFLQFQRPLRLDAFEHYVRGLLASDDDVRVKELNEAVRLDPDWPAPSFALGQAAFSNRDCASAITWFARVPSSDARYVEAEFTSGVCQLLLNEPKKAEMIFTSLQESLKDNLVSGGDLPEILNDLALARARQGQIAPAIEELGRATDLDPDEDDYPFNLGLLYLRSRDPSSAAEYFRMACDRQPDNPEDHALLIYSLMKAGDKDEAEEERSSAEETLGPGTIPKVEPDSLAKLERVTDELDLTSLQLEIISSQSASSGTSADGSPSAPSAYALVRQGRSELAAGHLDKAEAAYRSALAIQPEDAPAHRGLAEVLRRQGKLDDAVKELQTALDRRDSAVDRTLLARIYLQQKKPDLARDELKRALKLAPSYAAAKQLMDLLQSKSPEGKSP